MTLRKQHFFSDTEGPVYIQIQRDHDRLQDQNQFKPEKIHQYGEGKMDLKFHT